MPRLNQKRLIKNINNFVKKLDSKVVFLTAAIFFVTFLIVKNGFININTEKGKKLKAEREKSNIAQEIIKAKAQDKKIIELIFDSSDVGNILSFINSFIEKNKLKIINVSPKNPVRTYDIDVRDIEVNVEGKYNQILGFLSDIENCKKGIIISDMNMAYKKQDFKNVKDISNPDLSLILKLKIFSKTGE